MSWVLAALVLSPVPQDDFDATPGPRQVRMAGGFSRRKSTTRDIIRDAKIGETVQLIGVEGTFAKVRVDGVEAWISKSSLAAPAVYDKEKGPANEKELMAMKAQGFEAGRFDPETENELRKLRPNLVQAYGAVDRLEKRLEWTSSRAGVLARLETFQKEGGLAEFGTVK